METILIHKTSEEERRIIASEISKQLSKKIEDNPYFRAELCIEINIDNPDLQVITTNVSSSVDIQEAQFKGDYMIPADPNRAIFDITLSPLTIIAEDGEEYQLDIDYNKLSRSLSRELSS